MSNERFIKFIPSEESDYLQENHPNAFLLLCLIARRARRTSGNPDGLEIGEAHIGDYKKSGIETRDKYRTALDVLIRRSHIDITETCRTRKICPTKTPTGSTTIGTKIKLLRSDVWDINSEVINQQNPHPIPHRTPTEPPPNPHEQERKRKKKNEKDKIIQIPISLILRKENIFTSQEDHDELIKIHGKDLVEASYEHLSQWKKEKPDSEHKKYTDIGRLRHWAITACREKLLKEKELSFKESKLKNISQPQNNKNIALNILSDYLIPNNLKIELLSNHIEFIVNGAQRAICIEYQSHGFEEQLNNAIIKTRCKKKSMNM